MGGDGRVQPRDRPAPARRSSSSVVLLARPGRARGRGAARSTASRFCPPVSCSRCAAASRTPRLATLHAGRPNGTRGLGLGERGVASGPAGRERPLGASRADELERRVAATPVRRAGRVRYSSSAWSCCRRCARRSRLALQVRRRRARSTLLRRSASSRRSASRILSSRGCARARPRACVAAARGQHPRPLAQPPLDDALDAAGGLCAPTVHDRSPSCARASIRPPARQAPRSPRVTAQPALGRGSTSASLAGAGHARVASTGGTWGFRSCAGFDAERRRAAAALSIRRPPGRPGSAVPSSPGRARAATRVTLPAVAEVVNTNQFKNGMHIEHRGSVWRILDFQHVKPGKGGAFVRTKLAASTPARSWTRRSARGRSSRGSTPR